MLTQKVNNYPARKLMREQEVCTAVFVEILREFKIITKNNMMYGQLINLHFDLNWSKQNRIKSNENRSPTKG